MRRSQRNPKRHKSHKVAQQESNFFVSDSSESSSSSESEDEAPTENRISLSVFLKANRARKPSTNLPNEILVKIFSSLLKDKSPKSFLTLANICLVCDEWREMVLSSGQLWTYVDLSVFRPCASYLLKLSEMGLLRRVHYINFTGWEEVLTRQVISLVFRSLHNIKSVILHGCYYFDSHGLTLLSDASSLEEIDFSSIHTGREKVIKRDKSLASFPLFSTPMNDFFSKCGPKLKSINLSQNRIIRFNQIFKSILEFCPNLETLDLSNVLGQTSLSIKVDALQSSFPNLVVIRLGNMHIVPTKYETEGFHKLEELSIPVSNTHYDFGHNDDVLLSFAHYSPNLKLLDIRGSQRITACCLLQLKTQNLQHLAIDGCNAIFADGIQLVLGKWKHSLVDLDISLNNHCEGLEAGIRALTDDRLVPLESINLRGSAISFTAVMCLVMTCKKLKCVDLQSCRALPRGTKRVFRGSEIQKLRSEIYDGNYDE